ncbi:MAG: serine/threonine protein kinase, partial [Myxococcales bacterium]|nr:serine/threonine protein kinase [Myxococcales bacterium]
MGEPTPEASIAGPPISETSERVGILSERPLAEAESSVLLAEGWAFDRYELLGRLAFGGMAEVYLAREPLSGRLSRPVVVKRILPHVAAEPTFVDLFLDEAAIATRLVHPHICHVYGFGEAHQNHFLAMEWIHGKPLGGIIRHLAAQGEALPPALVARIGADVCEALDYAHRATDDAGVPLEIVHRDVTPQNIMVGYDGVVKLLDFGVAKAVTRSSKTRTGMVRGKFPYMSPQHCLGKQIDGRTDLFSLGVCLYEAITGRALYHRETDFETARAIVHEPVPSIAEVAPEIPA